MGLRNKSVIVTGGAVRLGRALALALAGAGAKIVLHYNASEKAARETANEIEHLGGEVRLIRADFEEPEKAARQVMEIAAAAFGGADLLINSAAIFEPATLAETTGEIWDRHFAINLKAPCFLAKEFAFQFAKREDSPRATAQILNILDWRTTHPAAGTSHLAYTIAKSGLAALTKALAAELGPSNIRVNAIAPGAILPPPGQGGDYLNSLAQNNPLHRVGSPEDIVQAALYLLQAEFVTGEILHVNGGEHLSA